MKRDKCVALLMAFFVFALTLSAVQTNLLTKAAPGDWAQYVVSIQNETVPLLSVKDQKRWKVIDMVGDGFVRVDEYVVVGSQRTRGIGSMVSLNKPFEPVTGLPDGTTVTGVSESAETLALAGKSFACRKIVRKIGPAPNSKSQSKWDGTSTIWLSPDAPLGGLVKMENRYTSQLGASSGAQKIVETWTLVEFGLKNWKE